MKLVKKNVMVNGDKIVIVKTLECGTAEPWYIVEANCYKNVEHICRIKADNLFIDRTIESMTNKVISAVSDFLHGDTFTVSL